MCDFAVLCELWWGSAAAWSQLCEWAGFGCNAKQPLWEDFQTRNTQEVQYAGMQDQHRFVHNAWSVCLFIWPSRFTINTHTELLDFTVSICFFVANRLVKITLNKLDLMYDLYCIVSWHLTSESCSFLCRSSLQEEHHVLSLLRQAEAVGSLLSQVGPKTVLCHLWVIGRDTHPHTAYYNGHIPTTVILTVSSCNTGHAIHRQTRPNQSANDHNSTASAS